MTDTAQPLPDEQTEEGSLTPEMQQRAAALGIARQVLKSSALFGQNGVQHWSVQDLLTVSDYILGVGPFVPLKGLPISADAGWCAPKATNYDDTDAAEDANARLDAGELPVGLEHVATFRPSALDDAQPLAAEEREAYDDTQDDTDVLPAYPEDALPR